MHFLFKLKSIKGFSLVELMIVIAIISILAVIAIPSYQTYVQRARFAEVINTASAYKTAISLALQQGIAANELFAGSYGIPPEPKSTRNLASLTIENGIITATSSALSQSITYILKPNADGNTWTISGSCLKKGWCHD